MFGNVEVKSWAAISGQCPIKYYCDPSGAVDFMFGTGPDDYFEFGFDADSLREFLRVGDEALRHLESVPESR